MTRIIGFHSSGWINQIGPKEDILAFFKLVNELVVKKYQEIDWSLISYRFYKRYLRYEELGSASALMRLIQEKFTVIPTDTVDWPNLGLNENTQLKVQEKFLAGVFKRFFKSFDDNLDGAIFEKNKGEQYSQPLSIVVADIPEFLKDKLRLLPDYDNLEGEPFWLR